MPVASGMPALAAASSTNAMAGEGGVVQAVGVWGQRSGCLRRGRLAHLWRAGNRRGALSGGVPLRGNEAANYGGGETAKCALGLLWAWCVQGVSSSGSGTGRREIITAHPTPYQGQKSGGGADRGVGA